MAANTADNVFAPYHATVAVVFFTCALVFTMVSMNPACVAVSLAGSLLCSGITRGWRTTGRTLLWILPLWAVIAVINGFYSSSQAATTFVVGPFTFALQSFCYGLCAGGMITAVIMWFACAGEALSTDESMGIMARFAPNVALMTSQVLQLVPQMLRRGREVVEVQNACAPEGSGNKAALQSGARALTVLVGWAMEDGAVRDESMRSRDFGQAKRRTRYRYRRMRADDLVVIAIVGTVGVLACFVAASIGSLFQFYPLIVAGDSWWACLPGAVLMLAPAALQARSVIAWR